MEILKDDYPVNGRNFLIVKVYGKRFLDYKVGVDQLIECVLIANEKFRYNPFVYPLSFVADGRLCEMTRERMPSSWRLLSTFLHKDIVITEEVLRDINTDPVIYNDQQYGWLEIINILNDEKESK